MGVFEDVLGEASRKPEGLAGVIERRRAPRPPMLRASHTSMTSHLWELELVPAFGMNRLSDDINKLAERSVDRNIFFESEVLRSAWPRLTSLLAPGGCWMVCLWETIGEVRHLRLFFPARLGRVGFPFSTVFQVLSNEFMPLGVPLLDRGCAGEAAETLLRLLSDPVLKLDGVIDFTHQRQQSKTFEILMQAAADLGLESRINQDHERAALLSRSDPDAFLQQEFGGKRMRELRRQWRRLGEQGVLEVTRAKANDTGVNDVLDAFEAFITLELKSWKGRRGTALYNHKRIAAFSRQIVAELAAVDGCEIHSLRYNGRTIASLILLGRDGHLVPWKMAYDEDMKAFSPGMQVMLRATEAMLKRPDFAEADSLATQDHWMMNRLWPDRIAITDVTIAVNDRARSQLEKVVSRKNRLANIKKRVRSALSLFQRRVG